MGFEFIGSVFQSFNGLAKASDAKFFQLVRKPAIYGCRSLGLFGRREAFCQAAGDGWSKIGILLGGFASPDFKAAFDQFFLFLGREAGDGFRALLILEYFCK